MTDQVFDPSDWEAITALLIHPENITYRFDSRRFRWDDTKNPFSDIITARLEHQFTPRVAASVSLPLPLHDGLRDSRDHSEIRPSTTPFDYTSAFTGRTFHDLHGDRAEARGVRARQHRLLVPARHQAIAGACAAGRRQSFLNVSFIYEHTTGNRDNNECGVLSLCTNGVDGDPN